MLLTGLVAPEAGTCQCDADPCWSLFLLMGLSQSLWEVSL